MRFHIYLYLILATSIIMSCSSSGDEVIVAIPPTTEDAQFSFSFDPENPNRVFFTGAPKVDTWFTHWNFGDNSASDGIETSRLYPVSGTYEVTFKIFTEGGQAESSQTLDIELDLLGPNLVDNSTFDSDASWTALPIAGGVEVLFENGQAIWSGGGWGQAGIYQKLNVEANKTYQIDMNVVGSGMSDCWFEVYVGKTVPTPGVDYTDGGILLGLNTWDGCGSTAFDGPLTLLTCSASGGDGGFQFEEDSEVYLVIRSGGSDLGAEGVSIDDITVRGF